MTSIHSTLCPPPQTSVPQSSPSPPNQNSTLNVPPLPLLCGCFGGAGLIVEMAGNIIPAIATTNAIVAGLCVLQARHVLRGELEKGRMVFISRRGDQAFIAESLRPPNPYCPVCAVVRAELTISPSTTLQQVPHPHPTVGGIDSVGSRHGTRGIGVWRGSFVGG
jgi:hypothetical protein